MTPNWNIALIAHDNKKVELLAWADYNRLVLSKHHLYATGTTGARPLESPGTAGCA